tara:strand:+ start:792 stop:1007 length:216 start_codon:yes stop_codon:yes gene_type:complete
MTQTEFPGDWRYSEEQMKVRQNALRILKAEFFNGRNERAIYECADEWSSKQVTTNGIVSYFKAYFKGKLSK